MIPLTPSTTLFYVWWLFINGLQHYWELDFICSITGRQNIKYMLLWLTVTTITTFIVVYFQLSGMPVLHLVLLVVFLTFLLKIQCIDIVAPVVVVFTLSTFLEGFSALGMYLIAGNVNTYLKGTISQILLSAVLTVLFGLSLRIIRKRYAFTAQNKMSSYLYILLLPCAFIVFAIRQGLHLDKLALQEYLSTLDSSSLFFAFIMMIGAVVVFFIMIEVFCKILHLAQQETSMALLASQVQRQKSYIEEAGKRNIQYASFQHDINNHLLVLTGLIHRGDYEDAEQYAKKLHISMPAVAISTGNAIADTLLTEKWSYAKENEIKVNFKVSIPTDFGMDDMDLCVVLANIIDNAIQANMNLPIKERFLSLTTKTRAQFLMIEAENPTTEGQSVEVGIGLSNVNSIAQKYKGTAELQNSDGSFRISVLLCSSKTL